jgi:hypothetical protein
MGNTEHVQLFDRSNPCCLTESRLPDFIIFNDNKSTGELIRDGASNFRYELGKVYNEKFFDQLTGRVLPQHYWLDPQFVSYLLALMFQVAIILIGKPYNKPEDTPDHRLGTEIYFYRQQDDHVQKLLTTVAAKGAQIIAPFPNAITIYYDGARHYNKVIPRLDGFLSGVPQLTDNLLIVLSNTHHNRPWNYIILHTKLQQQTTILRQSVLMTYVLHHLVH